MSEEITGNEENISRYEEMKSRLKKRISQEVFDAMPEYLQNYLIDMPQEDFKEAHIAAMLKLPWLEDTSLPDVDLFLAKSYMDQTHYAMEDVKDKVLRYMACQKHLGKNYGAVLLLVGPPGVGKTTIAASIAHAMGRPCVKISLAGVSDALFLRGVQQVFHNANTGRIVDAVVRCQSFHPVILLDEIDKMGKSMEHGAAENVLLDLLDSDRSRYVDNYLNFPIDLSNAVFIATANELETLSPVLLDRMDVVQLPAYRFTDKEAIVRNYVWPKLVNEYELNPLSKLHDAPEDAEMCSGPPFLTDEAIRRLIRDCKEDGVRDLEKRCRTLCEAIISMYFSRKVLYRRIDIDAVEALLGSVFY